MARRSSNEDIRVKVNVAPERERRYEESGAKHVSGYLMMVYMPKTGLACSFVTM